MTIHWRLNHTFYVLDSDILPDGPETPVSVERNSVIRMPIALKITPLDVHAYIIPPEHKVLALWPGTTTYYEGIVLTREGAKVYSPLYCNLNLLL